MTAATVTHPAWCAHQGVNCGDHVSRGSLIAATGGQRRITDDGVEFPRLEVLAKRADETGAGATLVTVIATVPTADEHRRYAEADLTPAATRTLLVDARLLAHDLAGILGGHTVRAGSGRGSVALDGGNLDGSVTLTVTDYEQNIHPVTVDLRRADLRCLLAALAAAADLAEVTR